MTRKHKQEIFKEEIDTASEKDISVENEERDTEEFYDEPNPMQKSVRSTTLPLYLEYWGCDFSGVSYDVQIHDKEGHKVDKSYIYPDSLKILTALNVSWNFIWTTTLQYMCGKNISVIIVRNIFLVMTICSWFTLSSVMFPVMKTLLPLQVNYYLFLSVTYC